jgi:class 3 adenylate cyclase/predicted ATPase
VSLFNKRTPKPVSAAEQPGERRQLTVLFYDIVGSTSLVEGNDPETLRAALNLIHDVAREVLEAHNGSLEQVMGDGGMAYFGYPIASEDAALSAVNAALDLISARGKISDAPNIRVGIATGIVALADRQGAGARVGLGAVGVAPNLAARLEAASGVNQILVAQATYALTHRAVEYEPVDGLKMKGFPDVSRAWRPLALRPIASRFERDRNSTGKFKGRAAEVAQLSAAWTRAMTREGDAIVIEGELGIGKSRIVSELAQIATKGRMALLQCQPGTGGDALFSFIDMYERAFDEATDPQLADVAVRTADRLGALEEDESRTAHARREAIVTAVTQELLTLTDHAPLLLVAEDLHWADEVTLAVLERLGTQAKQNALLIVATSRPDGGLENLKATFSALPLSPIGQEEALALIDVTAQTELALDTRNWIVARADGNPLFLTELTTFAAETVAMGGQLSDISGANVGSLGDLLSTRLDSAGVAKRTAQIASVLSREFPYSLLTQLTSSYNKQELDADLQRLVDHGLTDIIGNGYSYAFRHALIRDVAYDSQLRSVRQALHGKIVDLVDADPKLADVVPEILLAEHCLAANRTARGIAILLGVIEDAIRRSALRAPYKMLERVLTLSETLAVGLERDLVQLKAITLLGPLMTLLEGPRSAAPLYERGQKLFFALPEANRQAFFPVLWGWWFTASNLVEQTRRSEILIRDVTPQADPESRLQALHCGWATLFDGGAHDRCLSTISDGLALYDPIVGQQSRYLYGHDAKVCGLGERALCGWLTGQLELSAQAVMDCESWADETAHLSSQLHGLDIASQAAFFRHDLQEIDRLLNKMERLSDVVAVPAITAKRQIFRGWMAARAGDTGQIDAVTQGLNALRGFGVLEDVPFYADVEADVVAASGKVDAAIGPLNEAIEEARSTGLTYWLPELLRRKAILSGGIVAAQAFDEGFEVAMGQNAQTLVLRNVASRLDLGLAIAPELILRLGENIARVSDCALRRKVVHALAL